MELDSVEVIRDAFYRLVGTVETDDALMERGEAEGDVAFLALTRGCRLAQRWMIKVGYGGWRTRSPALTWSGDDQTTGGRYSALPTDFLRAYGHAESSALREPNGRSWGTEITENEGMNREGNFYFVRGEQLWITRLAVPPTTLYLEYHFKHPVWDASLQDSDIDFPMDARNLIVAYAADVAKQDNWLPGGIEMEAKIERALQAAREEARDVARPTKEPRKLRKVARYGNNW